MENRTAPAQRRLAPELQCGHDPEAVENRSAGRAMATQTVDFNAATTRRPWRTARRHRRRRPAAQASMRPRPGGRGERRARPTIGRRRSFNAATTRRPWRRPRPAAPGDVGSFNAATTRRPWRTAAAPPSCRRRHSFNAATTRRPWRTRDLAQHAAAGLQCGHDPEAVESPAARTGCPRGQLQCGHDPEAVENDADAVAMPTQRSFNAATTRRPWRSSTAAVADPCQASMRPRPGGRGEPGWSRRPAPSCSFNAATTRRPWRAPRRPRWQARQQLQCGHDPEAVEIRSTTASAPTSRQLQCGHDPEAVESLPGRSRRRTPTHASMRPRPGGRGEPPGGRRRARRLLQCGHDPEAVENCDCGDIAPHGGRMLQCGHDPEAVENDAAPRRRHRTMDGFNAATTRRPWRASRSRMGTAMRQLQCGHDPEAVENRDAASRVADATVASMRPRPGGRGEPASCGLGWSRRTTASMRPRPGGRGESPVRQYGRRRSLASMRPRPGGRGEHAAGAASGAYRLQCGHDPEAVESHRGLPDVASMASCFNAATTRRPWRAASLPTSTMRSRFNAATTRRPWRARADGARTYTTRFNAATTRRPWRTARWHGVPRRHRASMRPRPGGRGEPAPASRVLRA